MHCIDKPQHCYYIYSAITYIMCRMHKACSIAPCFSGCIFWCLIYCSSSSYVAKFTTYVRAAGPPRREGSHRVGRRPCHLSQRRAARAWDPRHVSCTRYILCPHYFYPLKNHLRYVFILTVHMLIPRTVIVAK
jgi:hypothetical protein